MFLSGGEQPSFHLGPPPDENISDPPPPDENVASPPLYGRAATGYLPKEIYRWLFTPVNVSCHSSWDYYSQCHWPRCVRRWAGNHSASDVNVSGGQSTQLGHGETLAFWILFLNPSLFWFQIICVRIVEIEGRPIKALAPQRVTTSESAWG